MKAPERALVSLSFRGERCVEMLRRTEHLSKDIMRDLLPRKPLPHREADGDGRVEVSTRSRGARDDGESDPDRERPAHLEDAPEPCIFLADREGGDGRNTGEDVEEDAGGFGHHLAQPAGAGALEVELALRDGLGGDHMAADVMLDCFRGSDLEVVCMKLMPVVSVLLECHVREARYSPARCGRFHHSFCPVFSLVQMWRC